MFIRELIGGDGGLQGAVRTEPRRPGCRSLSVGLPVLRGPLFLPGSIRHGQHGGHYRLLAGLCCEFPRGPTPSITMQPFPRSVVRLRASPSPWDAVERRGTADGWMDADKGVGWVKFGWETFWVVPL